MQSRQRIARPFRRVAMALGVLVLCTPGLSALTMLRAGAVPVQAAPTRPGPYPGATPFRTDGTLTSAPATVAMPSLGEATFVAGPDGSIYWSTPSRGWQSLGAPPVGRLGDPAAVSWGDGRIDLFVRGRDNRLWQRWTVCSGCQWSGWLQPVGNSGTLASAPTATSWGRGHIDVFVLGTDGRIYQRTWNQTAWSAGWVAQGAPPPGAAPDRPGASSWGPGRIDVFVRGRDNKLWQKYFSGSRWSGWLQPQGTQPGTLASAPSPSPWGVGLLAAPTRLTVFVRGTTGKVYQTTWSGAGWSAWSPIGRSTDVVVGAPAAPTTLELQPYVVGWGTNNRAYAFNPSLDCASRVFNSLPEVDELRQLFIIGVPVGGIDAGTAQLLSGGALGGVILTGNSTAGTSGIHSLVAAVKARVPRSATAGLLVAADQEGGQVQPLQGPGFERMPTALQQGTLSPAVLQGDVARWGSQLVAAGVNLNLAPVLDVVPAALGTANQPIGRYARELGNNPATVSTAGTAIIRGMQGAGVAATMKHFPGLGRVIGNTDVTANVVDSVTTRHDPYLAPFAAGVTAGVRFAMVSTAIYKLIDPAQPAAFSPTVITGMLRGDLHFQGIVVSDDLGGAQQVLYLPAGQRAIDFFSAGGTMAVVVRPPSAATAMISAIRARADSNPGFRHLLDVDALEVLRAKQDSHLLTCS